MTLYQSSIDKELALKIENSICRAGKAEDKCWIWIKGGNNVTGYGATSWKGKRLGSHVASYIAFKGEVPKGMCVCHKCDVRLCCNPDHLFLGTQRENFDDMTKKGRQTSQGGFDKWKHDVAEVLKTIKDKNLRNKIAKYYYIEL